MSTNPRVFPGNNLNGVDKNGLGKLFLIPIVFPSGQSIVTFDLEMSDRISPVKSIGIQSYSFTIAPPPLAQELPAVAKFGTYNSNFLSANSYYGRAGDGNSVPIVLSQPIPTANGNTRFTHTFDTPMIVSQFPPTTNKAIPSNAKFFLSCAPSLLAAPPTPQPGNWSPLDSITFAGESCVLLVIETWGEHIEDWVQEKKNIPKGYYFG